MTPSDPKKGKGLLIIAGKPGGEDDSPAPLSSPEEQEPDADDMDGPPKGECSGCVYYDAGMSQCKRYPQWVDRMPQDWCGEMKAGPTYDGDQSSAGQSQPAMANQPPGGGMQ